LVSPLMRMKSLPDFPVELLQKISSDLNKSSRESFLDRTNNGMNAESLR
jgi:hypothetical protein